MPGIDAAGLSARVAEALGGPAPGARASRLLLDPMSFRRRPDARNPRRWVAGVAAAGAVTVALRRRPCTRSTGAQPGS